MVDSMPVMEQYNELLRILSQFTQHNMKMNECIAVLSVIDKLTTILEGFQAYIETSKRRSCLWYNLVVIYGLKNHSLVKKVTRTWLSLMLDNHLSTWLKETRKIKTTKKIHV